MTAGILFKVGNSERGPNLCFQSSQFSQMLRYFAKKAHTQESWVILASQGIVLFGSPTDPRHPSFAFKHSYPANLLNNIDPLVPPNPNEFVMIVSSPALSTRVVAISAGSKLGSSVSTLIDGAIKSFCNISRQ